MTPEQRAEKIWEAFKTHCWEADDQDSGKKDALNAIADQIREAVEDAHHEQFMRMADQWKKGKAEAFEEAAKIADEERDFERDHIDGTNMGFQAAASADCAQTIADAIRAKVKELK